MSNYHNISDFVVRVKNAVRARHSSIKIENTKMTRSLANILLTEGFVEGISYNSDDKAIVDSVGYRYPENKEKIGDTNLMLQLRYVGKRNAISDIKVISKPGTRIYSSSKDLPRVLGGLGVLVLTTSKGVMTDKKARALNIGGELLFSIW